MHKDLTFIPFSGSDSVGLEEEILPYTALWFSSRCLGYGDCRKHTESHCCVFVTLRIKSASSCPCGFHKTTYNQTESKIKSPTNTARRVVKCLEQK